MEGENKNVIVLAGMIGAGKSTITKLIAEDLKSEAFYEHVDDNQLLEKFYKNPERWAFSLQIFFLNTRFRSIKKALTHHNNVLDRSIYEDELFTRINYEQGNMSAAELTLYTDLLNNMMEELDGMPKKAPDLLMYLRGSLDTHLERIKKRGRSYEQIEGNTELYNYYEHLHSRYDTWFNEYDKSPTLIIDIDKYNVERVEDKQEVLDIIKKKLGYISVHV